MSNVHDFDAETVRRLLVDIEATAPAPDDLEDRLLERLDHRLTAATRRPIGRVVGGVLVAAAVAAVAVIVAVRAGDGAPQPAAPAPVERSLGFAIRGSGVQASAVAATYGSADPVWAAQVSTPHGLYSVYVHPSRRQAPGSAAGTRHVSVGGTTGWYGCLSGDGTLQRYRSSCRHVIIWPYRPGAYAEVTDLAGFDSLRYLLYVARSLDFAATTSLRTAITLPAPAGMVLTNVSSRYRQVPGITSESATQVQFRTSGASSSVLYSRTLVVQLVTGDRHALATAGWPGGGAPITVAGRPARWRADARSLVVRWAPQVWLLLSGDQVPLPMMRKIAASTRVTPHLGDPSRWFDARDTFR